MLLDLQQSLNEVWNGHEQSILEVQEFRRALSDGFGQQVCLYSRQSMASLETDRPSAQAVYTAQLG
jgi:hypothetical protein